MPSPFRSLIVAVLAGGVSFRASAVEVRTTVLAKTGDPVAALGAGFTWAGFYTSLSDAAINEAGFIVFAGTVAGPGVDATNATVLAAGPISGPHRIVARGGTPAPGTEPGVVFNQPALGFLTTSGRVLFSSTLAGPGITTANDSGLWLESNPPGGSPTLVIREGGSAPGFPGLTIALFDVRTVAFQPALGAVALPAVLAGPGVTAANSGVLYASAFGAPTPLAPVARSGDPIPGQVGISYGAFGGVCFSGGAGSLDLLFRNTLVSPAITTANDGAMLHFVPGDPVVGVVIRESGPIPGQPAGVMYNQLLSPYALPSGQVGYFATALGIATPNGAEWIGSPLGASGGNPRPLALRDTPAPGFPAGSIMSTAIIDHFSVAATGRAAYFATCTGPGVTTANDTALFSEGPAGVGSPTLLAREGSVPPGLAAPSAYANMAGMFTSAAINARHQAAMFLYAPGVGTPDVAGDTGLWVSDASGNVQLVAHRTRPFALSATDSRTPTAIGYRLLTAAQAPPSRTWFLDDGRLITSLAFSDGTAALLLLQIDPPPPPCIADFNHVDGVSIQDLFDFLVAWFGQQPNADVNGVDGVSLQDLFDFLHAWFTGCA